jgi:PAS domain S-box-containing protein
MRTTKDNAKTLGETPQAEEILLFLAQTSSGFSEEPFFDTLVKFLAAILKMDFVCIVRLNADGLRATTVAVWRDAKLEDNFSFALKDTPCRELKRKSYCCYQKGAAQLFPRDQLLQELQAESYTRVTVLGYNGAPIGLITVIGRCPLSNPKLVSDTLNMVSIRVAGELERLEAEAALRESEERFKALHNASFGGIAIHDQGVILDCNQGLSDMMGYSREELIGMNGYLLIAPDSRQIILDHVAAHSEEPYEAYGMRKNGEKFPMRLEARVIPYKGKSVRSVEFRDLSQQKLAEKMLRERDEDLKEAQQIARLGSWRLDLATNNVVWSEELYKIYGFDPQLPPPPYPEHSKLFTKASWDALSEALAHTAATGVPYELELETLLKEGATGWMWVHGKPVRDDAGQIVGLRGAAQDITERKLAEQEKERLKEQLNQTHKMELLGQLAGGVAHDFNNLLTVIMGYSAELCAGTAPLSQIKQDAEEVFKASVRAKELTQQLLTFSRKQVLQTKTLDLNALICNLNGVFLRLIGTHIEIVQKLTKDSVTIYADQGQIEQLIINLVINSRDAMPKGGKIYIETSLIAAYSKEMEEKYQVSPGKYVLLTVTDTGPGIPKEVQSKLFEPFVTTKGKGKGLGLGLFNVMNIVDNYNGKITVESEAEQGPSFKILLPYSAGKHFGEAPEAKDPDIHGHGELILIVEDEEALAKYFQKMVSKLGYEVCVAYSGAEALHKLNKEIKPELVISDIIMPGINGRELAERIRELLPQQKLLFMSGFTDDILQPLGVSKDQIPFIQKPFTALQLAKQIKAILQN